MATLYTIGHSTRTLDELIEALQAHSIGTLVDIRAFPMSRRLPGAKPWLILTINFTRLIDNMSRRSPNLYFFVADVKGAWVAHPNPEQVGRPGWQTWKRSAADGTAPLGSLDLAGLSRSRGVMLAEQYLPDLRAYYSRKHLEPSGRFVRDNWRSLEDELLGLMADAICAGRPIQVFNHGNMARDFTYVDDIVAGTIAALYRPPSVDGPNGGDGEEDAPHRIYNLGNNHPEKLLDFIAILERALGRKADCKLLPMQPGDVPASYADIDASRRDLGFSPTTPLSVGLPRFVSWS